MKVISKVEFETYVDVKDDDFAEAENRVVHYFEKALENEPFKAIGNIEIFIKEGDVFVPSFYKHIKKGE